MNALTQPDSIERIFERLRDGDLGAHEELFPLVYDELHRLARAAMARQRRGHTLQATALVHEAFLKLCNNTAASWNDERHYLRVAARAMRQVLLDSWRKYDSEKRRPLGERIELDGLDALFGELQRRSGGLVALDAALERLEQHDPELVRLVELRFFGGHDVTAAAELLGISERTAHRRWRMARLFLRDELEA